MLLLLVHHQQLLWGSSDKAIHYHSAPRPIRGSTDEKEFQISVGDRKNKHRLWYGLSSCDIPWNTADSFHCHPLRFADPSTYRQRGSHPLSTVWIFGRDIVWYLKKILPQQLGHSGKNFACSCNSDISKPYQLIMMLNTRQTLNAQKFNYTQKIIRPPLTKFCIQN